MTAMHFSYLYLYLYGEDLWSRERYENFVK